MIIRHLHVDDHRSAFESGEQEIDRFFHRHAWPNHRGGLSRVYVAVDEPTSHDILGFYTLSSATVKSNAVDDLVAYTLPRYPIPAILIGQLAVALSAQGRGYGRALVRHALGTCVHSARRVAAFGILVDALNDEVIAFYRRFGFTDIPPEGTPQSMFLPIATVEKALSSD